MKKLIVATLLIGSFQLCAADYELITLHMLDKPFTEVVEEVNKVCSNSKLEPENLNSPDKAISVNFVKMDCRTVIELMTDFDGEYLLKE